MKKLKIIQLNARGILKRNKIELLKNSDITRLHEVILVTETHIDEKHGNSGINLENFTTHRRDRDQYGGGLLMYVSKSTQHDRRREFERTDSETIIIRINGKTGGDLFIIGAYRPPSSKANRSMSSQWFTHLESTINDIQTTHIGCKILIMGDLNADIRRPKLSQTKSLQKALQLGNLKLQRGETATRTATVRLKNGSTQTSSSCIDIFAGSAQLRMTTPVVGYSFLSDHNSVSVEVKHNRATTTKPRFIIGRNIMRMDKNAMKMDLAATNWNQLFEGCRNVHEMTDKFIDKYTSALDKCAPRKKMPYRKERVPWMSQEIKEMMKRHRKTYQKREKAAPALQGSFDDELVEIAEQLRVAMKSGERAYNTDILQQKNASKTWCAMKSSLHLEKGEEAAEIHPDELNKHFASIVGQTTNNTEPQAPLQREDAEFDIGVVTEDQVRKLIMKINPKKAYGNDEIAGSLLKIFVNELTAPITHLMNESIASGEYPDAWKRGEVTGIWKRKGLATDPACYRPVTVLSVVGKLLDKIVDRRLYQYAVRSGAIPSQQFAFRRKSSPEIALMVATEHWYRTIDRGKTVTVIAADLSKAFDTVNHQKLLNRLAAIGLKQSSLNWFTSYLRNRTQRVGRGGYKAEWTPISRGIPQGSALSPLLFSIYTGELPGLLLNAHAVLFADDLTIYVQGDTKEEREENAQRNMTIIQQFCDSQDLLLNPEKTQCMNICRSGHSTGRFKLSADVSVELQHELKFLGVVVDPKLSWRPHIENAIKKTRKVIGLMRSKGGAMPPEMRQMFYDSAGRVHLEYCSNVIGGAAKQALQRLDTADNEAHRMIGGNRRMYCSHDAVGNAIYPEPSLEDIGHRGDTLETRRSQHLLKTIRNSLDESGHPELVKLLNPSDLTERGLANRIRPVKPRTEMGRRSAIYRGAQLYNAQI